MPGPMVESEFGGKVNQSFDAAVQKVVAGQKATGDAAEKAANQARDASGKFVKTSQDAAKAHEDASKRAITASDMVTAAAGLGLGALAKSALGASAQFETAFAHMKGLVGVGDDDLTRLRDKAKSVGVETGVGAQAVADSMYYLTSAGLTTAQALDASTTAAKASAAGLGEMPVIADAASSAMNAYAKSHMTAGHAVDVMTAAVKYGKMEASALAQEIGQIIPTAANFGVTFEDVNAAIAALSLNGMTAGVAVTDLNQLITAMVSPTAQGASKLAEYGQSGEHLRNVIQREGLLAAVQDLRKSFAGHDDDLRRAIHSSQAFQAAVGLTGQNAEKVAQVFDGVRNSTGSLDVAFDAASHTMGFKWNQTVAQARLAMIQMGDAMAPAASSVIGGAKDILSWWSKMPPVANEIVLGIAGIGTASLTAAKGIESIVASMGQLSGLGAAGLGVGVVGAAAFTVWRLMADEQRKTKELADKLTKALTDQGDPAYTLTTKMDALAKATAGYGEAAGDAANKVPTDFDRAKESLGKSLDTLGKAGVGLQQVIDIAKGGTDAWDKWSGGVGSAREANSRYSKSLFESADAADQVTQKVVLAYRAHQISAEQAKNLMEALDRLSDAYRKSAEENDKKQVADLRQIAVNDEVTAAWVRQRLGVDAAAASYEQLRGLLGEFQTLAQVRQVATDTGEAFKGLGGQILDTVTANRDAGDEAADAAPKWDSLQEAINDASKAVDGYLSTMMGGQQDRRQFLDDLFAAGEAITKNGKTLDINTEAGRKNAATFERLVKDTAEHVKWLQEHAGSQDDLNGAIHQANVEILTNARNWGLSDEQIQAYLDLIAGIPHKSADAAYAQQQTADAAREVAKRAGDAGKKMDDLAGKNARPTADLNADPFWHNVLWAYQTIGGLDQATATAHLYLDVSNFAHNIGWAMNQLGSGVFNQIVKLAGKAAGGPVMRGEAYMVGEKGPEIFMPGRSGTIIPNDVSAKLAGGAGGITVNVAPVIGMSASRTGYEVGQAVRRETRRQGGNARLWRSKAGL